MSFLGVFGHVVLDYIFQVPRLPAANTSIQVTARRQHFGGTGGNLARGAGRLEVKTALASLVGEDFPPEYREALEGEGVDLTDLRAVPGYPTPTAWIFSDPKDRQVAVIDQGPMDAANDFPLPHHTVETSEWIHLGTGRPEYLRQVLSLAREEDKRIAFDPAQEIHYRYDADSFRALFDGADFFFGNRGETKVALGYLGLERPQEMLGSVEAVIETRGDEGSTVYTSEARWQIPSIPPRAKVDVSGAGDAYRAGFYAGLRRGLELYECGLLGASAASFSLETEGPQEGLPRWREARERADSFEEMVTEA
ncbi:MAG: carbohydrate kinase family protein [Thermoplasmata archaeon]